ncbi:hypothetical protein J6590_055347 [Homalodisca vitripennis]|nr:hypothetical protein J6590_055347 [Homalodisca vitripennis]
MRGIKLNFGTDVLYDILDHILKVPYPKPDARRAAPARCDDSGRGAAEAQSSLTGFNVNGVSRMRS